MYISGGISLSVGINGNPIAIELAGTGSQLVSWTGGVGYSITVAAAPNILLLNGAIKINLASIAQAKCSLYFKYVNANDFTVALQATLTLNPGDFLGAIAAAASGRCTPRARSWCRWQEALALACQLAGLLPQLQLHADCCSPPAVPSPLPDWPSPGATRLIRRHRRPQPALCGQGDAQPPVQHGAHQEC